MKASNLFGPDLDRVLRDQRQMGRESWFAERQATLRFGGPSMVAPFKRREPAATLRAMTSFGLVGGELCGCSSPSCDTCRADGSSRLSCGCGLPWCEICSMHVGKPLPLGQVTPLHCFAAGDWADFIRPNWASIFGGIEAVALTRYDIHSHNFCASENDWEAARDQYASTGTYLAAADNETEARIDRLYAMKADGIDLMAVSGMHDFDLPDTGVDGAVLDDITSHAWNKYPSYILPFVRGFELGDATAPAYVESWLAAGFVGVGELFPHGHGSDFDDAHGFAGAVASLEAIFDVARRYGVPVTVHWEIGRVADPTDKNPSPSTAADNYAQLIEMLTYFECFLWSGDFRLILAHCGAGPSPYRMYGTELTDYETRLDDLLANYPGVYFDIAGMAGVVPDICDGSGNPNAIGELLLDRMALYPTRFMVGIDTQARSDGEATTYSASIPVYSAFLASSYSTLSAAQQSWIWGNNARVVLG